jgi:hypothetical protein
MTHWFASSAAPPRVGDAQLDSACGFSGSCSGRGDLPTRLRHRERQLPSRARERGGSSARRSTIVAIASALGLFIASSTAAAQLVPQVSSVTIGDVTVSLRTRSGAPTHGGLAFLFFAQIVVHNSGSRPATIEPVRMEARRASGTVVFGPIEALLDGGGPDRRPRSVRGRPFSIVRGTVNLHGAYRPGLGYGEPWQQLLTLRVNGALVELSDNPLRFRVPHRRARSGGRDRF